MSQSELPNMWGMNWKPRSHLDFTSEVSIDDLKDEVVRFIAERHDGHLRLVDWLFDEVKEEYDSKTLDGPAFHPRCATLPTKNRACSDCDHRSTI